MHAPGIDGIDNTGRHRLLALKANGETHVSCDVYDVDDLQAELMEIDENLARADLSPAQEAAHIARRKEIWAHRKSETKDPAAVDEPNCATNDLRKDGRRKGPQHEKEFSAEVAEVTGSSKTDLNRKIKRAEELGPDIAKIAREQVTPDRSAKLKKSPASNAERGSFHKRKKGKT